MSGNGVTTRFAPSPTGRLHVGNARTALFNALLARRSGGRFLLRIEDTDRERDSVEHVAALIEDLHWLGLAWDEGPGSRPGEIGADYFQSRRGELYRRHFDQLIATGAAYPCFCTPADLGRDRARKRGSGQAPRYSGRCRRLPAGEVRSRLESEPAALRFAVSDTGAIEFDDLVRGTQTFHAADIGDFVIRRSDGTPAFFFSNAVDDALMDVTHVLRGEDHLANTPRQILLLRALSLRVPRYGHLGLVVDDQGTPLSKRRGDVSLAGLRARGYLAPAVLNYLARLGRSATREGLLDLDGLAEGFEGHALSRGPAHYDESQLRHWQQEALRGLDSTTLWAWFGEETRRVVPDGAREPFIRAMRGAGADPDAPRRWARILFSDSFEIDSPARETIAGADERLFPAAMEALAKCGVDFECFRKELAATTGLRGRALFAPLRAAMTGTLEGPELAEIVPLIGPARARARLVKSATGLAASR
ncbi:MAG: glutamate--tRNA ligase [Acidiferrobacteraceae bacterium]